MTEPLYYATSLEVIAQQFDRQQDVAVKMAANSPTRRGREAYSAEARTWRNAADMLRSTEMTRGKPIGWRYKLREQDAWTFTDDAPTGISPTGAVERVYAEPAL